MEPRMRVLRIVELGFEEELGFNVGRDRTELGVEFEEEVGFKVELGVGFEEELGFKVRVWDGMEFGVEFEELLWGEVRGEFEGEFEGGLSFWEVEGWNAEDISWMDGTNSCWYKGRYGGALRGKVVGLKDTGRFVEGREDASRGDNEGTDEGSWGWGKLICPPKIKLRKKKKYKKTNNKEPFWMLITRIQPVSLTKQESDLTTIALGLAKRAWGAIPSIDPLPPEPANVLALYTSPD